MSSRDHDFLFGGISSETLCADRADLAALGSTITEMSVVDVGGLGPEELADRLSAMVKLDEQLARLIGSTMQIADCRQTHTSVGEKSVAALIRARTHVSASRASDYKSLADALGLFPSFAAAFGNQQICRGHIDVMVGLYGRADTRQVLGCETALCVLAVLCTTEEFRAKAKEWEAKANVNEHYDEYLKAQCKQKLWYGNDLFGNVHFGGTLDPVDGEVFINGVERKTDELWRLENELAEHEPGCERTPMLRRRADALIQLILDGLSAPAGSRRPEPLIEIVKTEGPSCTCGHTCLNPPPQTSPDPDVDTDADADCPASARPEPFAPTITGAWTNAEDGLEGAVWLPDTACVTNRYPQTVTGRLIPHHVVAELGETGRVRTRYVDMCGNPVDDPAVAGRDFSDKQKRFIRVRDQTCRHHGCNSPARHCEYDHVIRATDGGPTTVANGQLLCRFHHKWKHRNDPKPFKPVRDTTIQLE